VESKTPYEVIEANLLQTSRNSCTIEQDQLCAPLDLFQIERMLIPFLNQIRKAQGKKPVIVPKG